MQNIIAARGLDALQDSSRTTYEIMQLAQSDNKLMLSFSRKAQNDARVLKTITILTMIYLPASFVSVRLSNSDVLAS
jgi:Mg2+ and Co2+ transporter CorA